MFAKVSCTMRQRENGRRAAGLTKLSILCVALLSLPLVGRTPGHRGRVIALSSYTQGESAQSTNPLARWRPLQSSPGVAFVGSAACAPCHRSEASAQTATPMAHALELAQDCQTLASAQRLAFRDDPYSYQIHRDGKRSIFKVTEGGRTIAEELLYCFGEGRGGQTYLLQHDGALYEARVSYYRAIQGLDLTIGQPRKPASLEEALGRRLSQIETNDCFGCHAPRLASEPQLKLDALTTGVTCEACHGPGKEHIEAVNSGSDKNLAIFNPRSLDSNSLSQEFCGACHRGFDQVMNMPEQGGFQNVRFQPYRIFNSRGHNKIDSRISCIACHNPHEPLRKDSSFYDSRCLSCHRSSADERQTKLRAAAACSVAKKDCTKCHMPQVEIPGTHTKFTDHWIRIVDAKGSIPR
jgi:hypothetical protein